MSQPPQQIIDIERFRSGPPPSGGTGTTLIIFFDPRQYRIPPVLAGLLGQTHPNALY